MGESNEASSEITNFHSLSAKGIDNQDIDFSQFEGKVCVVSNIACQCGFAARGFETLRSIKEHHPEVELLLFPSKLKALGVEVDQEFKNSEETIKRLKKEGLFEVATIFSKCTVNKNAKVIDWLADHTPGIWGLSAIKWNFTKFLISKDGKTVKRYGPYDNYQAMKQDIIAMLEEN